MSFKPFRWECPYCRHKQVVVESSHHAGSYYLGFGKTRFGLLCFSINAINCANESCNSPTVAGYVHEAKWAVDRFEPDYAKPPVYGARLMPMSSSKPQPEYIPKPLRDDYTEACAVRDLSPKSAATLARRCLQGMIRDFCGISRSTLSQEIAALREAVQDGTADRSVTIESVEAIDNVRIVGNIGAHMERDINNIIDVDPGEAQLLIDLIELLFEEWYIARQSRLDRLSALSYLASTKKAIANVKK